MEIRLQNLKYLEHGGYSFTKTGVPVYRNRKRIVVGFWEDVKFPVCFRESILYFIQTMYPDQFSQLPNHVPFNKQLEWIDQNKDFCTSKHN
jgi:hypothetical protein